MAKKSAEILVMKSRLQESIDKMNKTYGVGTVMTMDSKCKPKYDIIPTGSVGFDYITLGIGGFAKGKLYELMGWEGSGKSTICGHAAAECQKKGGKVVYIDGEHALDLAYFEALGVDVHNMLISQPSSGEEGFNVAIEMISTGEVDLVIIDSDSSLLPQSVIDGEVGDSAIGKKARLNNNVYPKIKNLLVRNNTCVIVISQYREKIGVMFGNPVTTQGGHALKFYTDCRLEISKTLGKDGDSNYGNITKIKAVKNKMWPPFRMCQFDIIYGKGIDRFNEIIDMAIEQNIIQRSGSWFSFGDTKIGQGKNTVIAVLEDNPELFDELKERIMRKFTTIEEPVNLQSCSDVSELNELSNP